MATARPQAIDTEAAAKQQAAWEGLAAAYDDFTTPNNLPLAEEAIRHVGLRPNMDFLDVAAGSGALSIPAARIGARVTAVDYSPTMIDRLRARAREEGLSNLDCRVMDGHALEMEDESFDVAGSQFGVMLFPDLPRAVSELTRVTRSGGRVFLIVFGPPARLEFLTFFLGAIRAVVPDFVGLSTQPPPLPFQVSDRDVLHQRLAEARLEDIRVETVNHGMKFRSGRHLWDLIMSSNPLGAATVKDLSPEQKIEVQQVLERLIRERSPDHHAVLDNEVIIGKGTKK